MCRVVHFDLFFRSTEQTPTFDACYATTTQPIFIIPTPFDSPRSPLLTRRFLHLHIKVRPRSDLTKVENYVPPKHAKTRFLASADPGLGERHDFIAESERACNFTPK